MCKVIYKTLRTDFMKVHLIPFLIWDQKNILISKYELNFNQKYCNTLLQIMYSTYRKNYLASKKLFIFILA